MPKDAKHHNAQQKVVIEEEQESDVVSPGVEAEKELIESNGVGVNGGLVNGHGLFEKEGSSASVLAH